MLRRMPGAEQAEVRREQEAEEEPAEDQDRAHARVAR
jgi:hypothetical protein